MLEKQNNNKGKVDARYLQTVFVHWFSNYKFHVKNQHEDLADKLDENMKEKWLRAAKQSYCSLVMEVVNFEQKVLRIKSDPEEFHYYKY